MKIAFFDFDGTITRKDSLTDFIQYAVGKPAYYFGLLELSLTLAGYILKLISNHIAKEKLLIHFIEGWRADKFQELAQKYSLEEIDKITRSEAIAKLQWHQEQGHKVVIVSASMESWLKAWCDKHGIDLISTKLEIKENRVTGKFATKNCYGIEKAIRIKEKYDLKQYEIIYAYGDSLGDKEMLNLATKCFYKPFRNQTSCITRKGFQKLFFYRKYFTLPKKYV